MRNLRIAWSVLLLSACLLAAELPMTVAQLTDFIRSSVVELKYPDKQLAQYLKNVRLTERMDGNTLETLEGLGAGPKTREALEALKTASANLPVAPPAPVKAAEPELPVKPPPDSIEQKRIIDAVRDYSLNYSKQLPNFICSQVTRRAYDPDGTGDYWHQLDTITTKLTYFEQKENYEVVNVSNRESYTSYWSLGGTISGGEFGSMLREIFERQSNAQFDWERWGKLRDHDAYVFSYYVPQEYSRYHVTYDKVNDIVPGYRGLIYVDMETEMVLRVTLKPILPPGFGVKEATIIMDYDYQKIGDQEFLLPLKALVTSKVTGSDRRGRSAVIATRNDVEFRLYHKYGTETQIQFAPDPLPESVAPEKP